MITEIRDWHKKDENDQYLHKKVKHDDLKSCPFCGSEAKVTCSGSSWCICCQKCFAKSRYFDLPSEWNSNKCIDTHLIQKAVKAWNKRI